MGTLYRVEHRRVKGIPVVKELEAIARQERVAAGAGHRGGKFRRIDGKLVIKTKARGIGSRSQEIAHRSPSQRSLSPTPIAHR